jgi:hypothetical protein
VGTDAGLAARSVRPGEPGLALPLAASMTAFEAWFEG